MAAVGINAGNFAPTGNTKNAIAIGIVLTVIILVFIIFNKFSGGIDGLLEKLGLKDDKATAKAKEGVEDKVGENTKEGTGSAFAPTLWKSVMSAKIFTSAYAQELAKTVWDSVGYAWDTPNKAAGAIKQCKCKTQVSFLADTFQKKYSVDLLTWLHNKFDRDEQKIVLNQILAYVDALPLNIK